MSKLIFEPGSKILFQGDSITDAGRVYEDESNLGPGYPNFIASWLSANYPAYNLTFINKGVSGDRVCNLEARWTKECIDIQPDWLSILIGINDTWRRYDSNDPTSAEDYEAGYRRILDRVKKETKAKLIILEPYVLPTPPDRIEWREDLDPKIQAARRVARDYNAIYIPLDGIFAAASTQRPPEFWAADGVHPTQVGHALISKAWIEAVTE